MRDTYELKYKNFVIAGLTRNPVATDSSGLRLGGRNDITFSDKYDVLAKFMAAQGLEFDAEDETVPNDILKCWEATEEGELVGGAILALREGEFICDGIATIPRLHGEGLGKYLLNLLIDEAKARGGDKLYLVARAPGFFAKQGFEVVPREGAPNFFECFSCPQYGVSCHPEVMRLIF